MKWPYGHVEVDPHKREEGTGKVTRMLLQKSEIQVNNRIFQMKKKKKKKTQV